jgi:hypothetical protein
VREVQNICDLLDVAVACQPLSLAAWNVLTVHVVDEAGVTVTMTEAEFLVWRDGKIAL